MCDRNSICGNIRGGSSQDAPEEKEVDYCKKCGQQNCTQDKSTCPIALLWARADAVVTEAEATIKDCEAMLGKRLVNEAS